MQFGKNTKICIKKQNELIKNKNRIHTDIQQGKKKAKQNIQYKYTQAKNIQHSANTSKRYDGKLCILLRSAAWQPY